MKLPRFAELCEVGPRDGFQFEERPIPTDLKIEIVDALLEAGLRRVQVTSFVHPSRVPQMADAEEVVRRLGTRAGAVLSGLVLNLKGLERARACGLRQVDVSIATNERHSLDNANMTLDRSMAEGEEIVRRAIDGGMQVQIGFQTVFGYAEPGDTPVGSVLDAVSRFIEMDIESVSFADSTGMANPVMIEVRLGELLKVVETDRVVLHLHDTRGLGMANVVAALQLGVHRFDTSLGGMGGCPFIPGATGNIATEDTIYLLESMGVHTGVDLDRVSACALRMERFLGRNLPGRLHTLTGKSVTGD